MHWIPQVGQWAMRAVCAVMLIASAAPAAHANWLTRLAREAGEAGARTARFGSGALERAASHIKSLPATAEGSALAAHATPEGHWKFVNREGEVFTAGTPDELQRAVPALLPDAPPGSRLTLYLTEDTVFRERSLLDELPEGASLRIVVGRESYPLVRERLNGAETYLAAVRPALRVDLKNASLFGEAVARLERPLSRSSIRTLALRPGGPATLASSPRLDPATRTALVDAIDPAALTGSLSSVRGQTVLVTGRMEDNLLMFRPANGAEQGIKITDLIDAAAASDVNLVILNAPVPRQPGGRNWLWQRIAVDGLDDALKRATFGDFLDALGARNGRLRVGISREGSGRVVIRATLDPAASEPITGVVGAWLTDMASSVTGNVVTSAIEVHARDEARQEELDRRIVPWLPSHVQIAYLVGLVAGVMGWHVASGWWTRLWPAEARSDYRGAAGYRAGQAARFLAFFLVFLPVVGLPALCVSLSLQLFGVALLPFRFLRWLTARFVPGAG
jgi:hypothetical protein